MHEEHNPIIFNMLFIPRTIYRQLEKANITHVLGEETEEKELEKVLSLQTLAYLEAINRVISNLLLLGTDMPCGWIEARTLSGHCLRLTKDEYEMLANRISRDLGLTGEDDGWRSEEPPKWNPDNKANKYFDTAHQSEYSLVAVYDTEVFKEIFRSKDKFKEFVLSLLELIYDKEPVYGYQIQQLLSVYFNIASSTFTDEYLQLKTSSLLNRRS